jgi:MoaA/NifB/PqqE/SkfB family radical SAM enzyme
MQRRIPVSATFCLTHRCNLDCIHCYLRDDRDRAELTTTDWLGLIDQAAEVGAVWLTLTGGEPTLREDFSVVYRHAKRRGLLVTVMTNGSVLDDLLPVFEAWPPHCVDVSIYGYDRETYLQVAGHDVRDSVFEAVDALLARRIRVRVKTTVVRENIDQLGQIAEWSARRGLRHVVDGDIWPTLAGDRSVQQHRVSVEELAQLAGPNLDGRTTGCGAAQTGFYLAPDGKISSCLIDPPVADAATARLADVWCNELLLRRHALLETTADCASCGAADRCRSCSPILALEGGRSLFRCAAAQRTKEIERARQR